MQYRTGVLEWIRTHPRHFDATIAVVLLVANLAGMSSRGYAGMTFREPDLESFVLNVLCAAPLAFRRQSPVLVAIVSITSYMALGFFDYNSFGGSVAMPIAIYTLGTSAATVPGLAITLASGTASVVYLAVNREQLAAAGVEPNVWYFGSQFVITTGLWIIGRTVRARRLYLNDLEDRADRLERTATAELRAALAEERTRMARELHDVVAHHVSVMTVQAAAARRMIDRSPERSAEAMLAVEETGRAALVEMRRIVGALRSVDADEAAAGGQPDLTPQSGVAELEPLVTRAKEAGLEVDLTVVGEPRQLPSGVDLAIFRVVQESLTNTLTHAGPTRAAVLLRYEPDAVVVGVTDDGGRRRGGQGRAIPSDRPGHGLVGMRERVTLNGGTLRTGPRSVGGFEVQARLPLEEASQ
ncbi:sensor histidine kinase [Actinopolymorpha sp. B17G11]|uniref:sensor histidine kinase n=1 Tax=Actinopolymorpha sp. B17G11 TaxID=3160861 RepID=UPI0032E3B209